MGLWWYFFAEIFDHFRAFFLFVFHVQPALLLIPLTMRTRHTPLSLVLTTCLLITLFKVRLPTCRKLPFRKLTAPSSHSHAPQIWRCAPA
jgi:hypothetical protein